MGFRRMGRPGLIGTAARAAVVAGTASAVSGRVTRRQAAAAVTTNAEPTTGEGIVAQLERLGRLAAAGVLTPAEFAIAKTRLLA